jgi:ethanolamine utilization protein EutM
MKALGMIETHGLVSVIEAIDSMVKAASVEVLATREIGGGLVSVYVQGDVGAVKAAIDAGTTAAKKVGELVSAHIITRPSDETMRLLSEFGKVKPGKDVKNA